jgi:glycosyltransferase involved in cell wall biosynthesis
VENLIPAFDVVLQLSSVEGFGTSTVEAMACGVPVVGSEVPGTRDILSSRKGGILVPFGDEQAAADACALIIEDSAVRGRMVEEAREEAVRHYGEPVWEQKILTFYERAFAHCKPSTGPFPKVQSPI